MRDAAAAPTTPRPFDALRLFAEGLLEELEDEHSCTEVDLYRQTLADIEAAARSTPAEPLDEEAVAETLRYLYHADQPCDKTNEHRHEWIAQGFVGQYPRFLARLSRNEEAGG